MYDLLLGNFVSVVIHFTRLPCHPVLLLMLNPSLYGRSSTTGQQHGEAMREIAKVVLSTCPQHIVLLLEKDIGEFLLGEFAAKFEMCLGHSGSGERGDIWRKR